MKKIFIIVCFMFILSIAGLVLYNIFSENTLSVQIKSLTKYQIPENIETNAVIDFIGIQRLENITTSDIQDKLRNNRKNYDVFSPEKTPPILSEDEKIKFLGISWLYTCWLVPHPIAGPCLQPFAFKHNGIERNSLILDRYEKAIKQQDFAADNLTYFDESLFGVAMLYMASSSYYFYSNDEDEAIRRWELNHLALGRFLKNQNTFVSVTALLGLYDLSLRLAERFIINDLSEEKITIISQALNSFSPLEISPLSILSSEIGFYSKQINAFFRPFLNGNFFSKRVLNWFYPYEINNSLNKIVPLIVKFRAFEQLSSWEAVSLVSKELIESKDTAEVISEKRLYVPKTIIDSFYAYANSNISLFLNKTQIDAQQRALLLAIRSRSENVSESDINHWLFKQNKLFNPISNKPFSWNNEHKCIYVEGIDNNDFCIEPRTESKLPHLKNLNKLP